MSEIGRVIVFHAYVEWRLSLIVYDFLHLTKVLGRLVAKDARATDQLDLICDLISLKTSRLMSILFVTKVPGSVTNQRTASRTALG